MGSLSKGMESSTTTGMFNHISMDNGHVDQEIIKSVCICGVKGSFVKNHHHLGLEIERVYYLSLDVWGIGPGFDESATTFSVCTWLMIYYVVSSIIY